MGITGKQQNGIWWIGRAFVSLVAAVIFAVQSGAQTYGVLHRFAGSNGASPYGGLVQDTAGNFYGTTYYGGKSGRGTIFKLDTSGKETVLYSFSGPPDGQQPIAGLARDVNGNLYGTTEYGGDSSCNPPLGCGTVFELDTKGTETVLYSFTGRDGEYPDGGVVCDAKGSLYGVAFTDTTHGTGNVFELSPSSNGWTEKGLYYFTGGRDGKNPFGSVIFDSSGNLFGAATAGGVYGRGTVFKLKPRSHFLWAERTLYDFTSGQTGAGPFSGLTFDAKGNLYGTTQHGGRANVGIVFKLSPSRDFWKIFVLHTFSGADDGGYPGYGSLATDKSGNLYGTTIYGGVYEYGTLFKLTKSSKADKWKETVIHNFANRDGDGGSPYSGLIFDAAGNIYGTTSQGGDTNCNFPYGCGTVFKLTP